VEPPGLPAEIPAARGADDRFAMACAVYRGGTDPDRAVTVESFARVADGLALTDPAPTGAGTDGAPVADRVTLPGGRGALVATLLPPGATASGNVYVVTEQGIKYPLPRADLAKVQASLGFGGVRPVDIPGSMLALIPTGPALDPKVAALFAPPVVAPSTSP
jgi:hypothetical protein